MTHRGTEDTFIVLFIRLAGEVKAAAENKVEEVKEAGAQLADDASKKADEVKDAAQEKVDEAKEAGAQLAADASNTAEQATHTIVEKVQEMGAAVSIEDFPKNFSRMKFFVFLGGGDSAKPSSSSY